MLLRLLITLVGGLLYIGCGILLKKLFFPKVRWRHFVIGLSLILLTPIGFFLFRFGPFNEYTLYAPQYSEQAFDNIHQGMLKIDVFNALGPPLIVYESDAENRTVHIKKYEEHFNASDFEHIIDHEHQQEEIHRVMWCYTKQGKGTSDYHQRKVVFSKKGAVIDVIKSLYLD